MGEGDGPEAFDYDATVARGFAYGDDAQLTVLSSLEVEHARFDSNPATFVTELLATWTFEAFLAGAAGASVPAATHDAVRAYLLATRRAGSTTLLSIDVRAIVDAIGDASAVVRPNGLVVYVDEKSAPRPPGPGPHSAGFIDLRDDRSPRTVERRLVAPGPHVVRVAITAYDRRGAETVFASQSAERAIDVAKGARCGLRCTFDRTTGALALVPADPATEMG